MPVQIGPGQLRLSLRRTHPRQDMARHPHGKLVLSHEDLADVFLPQQRRLFVACYVGSFLSVVAIGIAQPWALLGLLALPLAVAPVRTILTRTDPPSLVAVLVQTSKLELVVAVLVSVGLCLS